jgi:hypothetical protein
LVEDLAFRSFQIDQLTRMIKVVIAFRFAITSFKIFVHHVARVRSSGYSWVCTKGMPIQFFTIPQRHLV